jgi:hypothetical protein
MEVTVMKLEDIELAVAETKEVRERQNTNRRREFSYEIMGMRRLFDGTYIFRIPPPVPGRNQHDRFWFVMATHSIPRDLDKSVEVFCTNYLPQPEPCYVCELVEQVEGSERGRDLLENRFTSDLKEMWFGDWRRPGTGLRLSFRWWIPSIWYLTPYSRQIQRADGSVSNYVEFGPADVSAKPVGKIWEVWQKSVQDQLLELAKTHFGYWEIETGRNLVLRKAGSGRDAYQLSVMDSSPMDPRARRLAEPTDYPDILKIKKEALKSRSAIANMMQTSWCARALTAMRIDLSD